MDQVRLPDAIAGSGLYSEMIGYPEPLKDGKIDPLNNPLGSLM